jgi:hypothetical protein
VGIVCRIKETFEVVVVAIVDVCVEVAGEVNSQSRSCRSRGDAYMFLW